MKNLLASLLALLAFSSFAHALLNLTLVGSITGLSDPSGVFVAADGIIWITDAGAGRRNSTLWSFDSNLSFISRTGTWGSDVYQFVMPSAVFFDLEGKRYVVDTGNNRVLIYSPGGSWLDTIGEGGSYTLNAPRDVFVDAERIYVADSFNDRVLLFNRSTRRLESVLGLEQFGEGKLTRPAAVFVHANRLYVLDHSRTGGDNYGRVAVFSLANLSFIGAAGRGAGGVFLNFPEGLAVDFLGRVYVADTGSNKVRIFWPDFSPMLSLGDANSTDFNFSSPRDVFVARGRLYVVDAGHGRVLIYNMSEISTATPDEARNSMLYANATLDYLARLNSSAARLGTTLAGASLNDYTLASLSLAEAQTRFAANDFASALQKANASLAYAASSRAALEAEVGARLAQSAGNLSARLEGVKADLRAFDVSLNTSSAEQAIASVRALSSAGDFEAAIQQLQIAGIELLNLEISLDAQTRATRALRESAEQDIAYVVLNSANLSSLAAAYKQPVDFSRALALAGAANDSLSSFDFVAARERASFARAELDALKAVLLERVASIDNASERIGEAEDEIDAVASTSAILLNPNLSEARSLLSQAKSLLYSDPDAAYALAVQAKQSAEREAANMSLLRPLVLGGIVGFALLLVILVVFFIHSQGKGQPAQP